MREIGIAFGISFLATVILMPVFIPLLRRLKFGQTIREIGPSWHQKKSGTPTMGGIGFLLAATVVAVVLAKGNFKALLAIFTCLAFGVIGFADDFIKVVLKRNLGLTEIQKLILQVLVSAAFLWVASTNGWVDTVLKIPYTTIQLNLGLFYFVFALILMVGFVNAVNLTDGVDGLAASVTMLVAVFFTLFCNQKHLDELSALPAAVAGGLFGFLFFNFNPAKVFMGDTGSLYLGGVVSVMAILSGYEILLLLVGIIYLIEAFSVMIQVAYYKKTKKRIFLMTPIHHHYEKKGWSENKIVTVFSLITLLGCIAGFFA